ncbi:MAG TPA: TetR/AcrR family transcriptional regulator [bacterium]|nr:TetR/AcrR family transcriptional regulator [bacterium]
MAKEEKSLRILDAAIRIFARKGFYNSTIADVAKVAEVAEGTIYLYFKNKDDLLISIFEHSMDLFIAEAQKELEGVADPKEKLQRFIALHLKLVQKNPELAQVLQIELRQSSKFMKEYEAGKLIDYLNVVRGILEEGQSQGVFRKGLDPRILRRAIFGCIDELALEWLLMSKKKYSLEACAEQVSDMFIRGITV